MSISRRNFLRGVGIGCSACAIGSFPPGALARNSPESIKGKTSLTPSLCEMCSYRCPIQAQVINNKTVFIQGNPKEGANKQVISSQADSLIKISRIWADFFPANTSNQPI
ncbi:twin-arginine translocation signal domain-containing protein [Citrobacter freundii]|nr:twin-arginine translocation signal domain-containing protein [Citrobacter freundii]WHW93968.1 twin-arginine translocation signal domain-containing protein [Citrobacter freundii]